MTEAADAGGLRSDADESETRVAERNGDEIVETAQEARGAEPGPTVRNVLVWSLGLVIVAFAIVYFIFFRG